MKNVAQLLTKGKKLSLRVTQIQEEEKEELENEEDEDMEDGDSVSSGSSFEIPKVDDDDQEDSDIDETHELKFDEFDVLDDNYNEKKAKKDGNKKMEPSGKNHQKTPVDDQFFKLREMEEFLLKEEQLEGKSAPDDDEVDYFEDVPSEEEDVSAIFL